jgi:putative membrane protein
MKAPAIPFSSSLLALAITASGNALAQRTASDTDKAFVAKVSQGGRYEVEASKLPLQKASTQNVKDAANSEVHDHELVNKKLKTISAAAHVSIAPALNPDFTQKSLTPQSLHLLDQEVQGERRAKPACCRG